MYGILAAALLVGFNEGNPGAAIGKLGGLRKSSPRPEIVKV